MERREITTEEGQEIERLRKSPNSWDHMRAANIEKWGLAPKKEDSRVECPECGNPVNEDGDCEPCSKAAGRFEEMAHGDD